MTFEPGKRWLTSSENFNRIDVLVEEPPRCVWAVEWSDPCTMEHRIEALCETKELAEELAVRLGLDPKFDVLWMPIVSGLPEVK